MFHLFIQSPKLCLASTICQTLGWVLRIWRLLLKCSIMWEKRINQIKQPINQIHKDQIAIQHWGFLMLQGYGFWASAYTAFVNLHIAFSSQKSDLTSGFKSCPTNNNILSLIWNSTAQNSQLLLLIPQWLLKSASLYVNHLFTIPANLEPMTKQN